MRSAPGNTVLPTGITDKSGDFFSCVGISSGTGIRCGHFDTGFGGGVSGAAGVGELPVIVQSASSCSNIILIIYIPHIIGGGFCMDTGIAAGSDLFDIKLGFFDFYIAGSLQIKKVGFACRDR